MSNTITIEGNLTRDPELRFTSGGKAACAIGIADSRRYQVNGEWTEKTTYWNGTIWEQAGENAAASLKKGDRVIVRGRIEQREYTTQQGEKRVSMDLVVEEIGVSLRWATAEAVRNPRSGDGEYAAAGNRRQNSNGNSGGSANQANDPFAADGDDPF